MATIKLTSGALGNLINQINGGSTPSATGFSSYSGNFNSGQGISIDDDSIPTNMLEVAPVFEINYKSTKKQCIKRAKDQISAIVKEVVPTILLNSPLILSKIDADAELLGNLYYEYEKTEKMILALMETIRHGETQARLFEVYARMTDGQTKASTNITTTLNQMRKYYIDTYMDLQQKDEIDENVALPSNNEAKAIEAPKEEPEKKNVIIGTENTVKMLAEKKKNALIAKYNEVK